MYCAKQQSKTPLPRLLLKVFLHLLFAKTTIRVTVLDHMEPRARLNDSALCGFFAIILSSFSLPTYLLSTLNVIHMMKYPRPSTLSFVLQATKAVRRPGGLGTRLVLWCSCLQRFGYAVCSCLSAWPIRYNKALSY